MIRRLIIFVAVCVMTAPCGCGGEPETDNAYDPNNDRVRPVVVGVSPAGDEIGVPVSSIITITMSEDVDTLSISSDNVVLLDGEDNIVAGVIGYAACKISLTPVNALNNSQTYTVILTDRVRDIAGNTLETDFKSAFTTGVGFSPRMIHIEGNISGAAFSMGSGSFAGSTPVHPVRVSSFRLGKSEVTFREYDEYCDACGLEKPQSNFGRDYMPVINVSWCDAVDYCNWLSDMCGLDRCYTRNGPVVEWDSSKNGYRLPTEAEWEYAAREGGQTDASQYSGYIYGVTDIDDYAWWPDNALSVTHEVASLNPNKKELYDMSGNVAEWCWDWYADYGAGAVDNPRGPATSADFNKVIRGGSWESWEDGVSLESEVATGKRYHKNALRMLSAVGFRVCRNYE